MRTIVVAVCLGLQVLIAVPCIGSDVLTSGTMSLMETLHALRRNGALAAETQSATGQPLVIVYEHLFEPVDEVIGHASESSTNDSDELVFDNSAAPIYGPIRQPVRRQIVIPRLENDVHAIGRALKELWDVDTFVVSRANALVAIEMRDGKRIDSLMDRLVNRHDLAPKMSFEDVRTVLRERYGMEDSGHRLRMEPDYRGYFLCRNCSDDLIWETVEGQEVRVRDLALALLAAAAREKNETLCTRLVSTPAGTWYFGR